MSPSTHSGHVGPADFHTNEKVVANGAEKKFFFLKGLEVEFSKPAMQVDGWRGSLISNSNSGGVETNS